MVFTSDGNFNSIKVRLEHHQRIDVGIVVEFQFHKGTIRTQETQSSLLPFRISIP